MALSPDDIKRKPSVHVCPRCTLVNTIENKFCSKCSYPLSASAFEEIKLAEETRIRILEEEYEKR
jgi:integrase/recombinase XerD